MDLRHVVLCLATTILVTSSFTYGIKFLRKRNYLLGIEWLVITFSASNFLLFFFTGAKFFYGISFFCDAFSRAFGIPVIAVAGLMAVTHGYRPSKLADLLFFAGSVLGTVVLVAVELVAKVLPYFYVAMWVGFSIYLASFASRLLRSDESLHALGVSLALCSSLAIAGIYDFYRIPGEDTNILLNFFVLAALTWSYVLVQLYYAYCALEAAGRVEQLARHGHALPGLEREPAHPPLA
jgi:hypothetical protein